MAVLAALDVLDLPQVDVVGWGSGGQVAVELARLAPLRVRCLLQLEPLAFGAAADALRAALSDTSIAPRWDGSHLVTAWSMLRDAELFFPWCDRTAHGVLLRDANLDPLSLDCAVQDLLKLGDRWRDVVQASVDYPSLERWAGLTQRCGLAQRRGNAATEKCQRLLVEARPGTECLALPDSVGQWTRQIEAFFSQ
jgi:pimeloyl-ACP methyl ester carboxylesterase